MNVDEFLSEYGSKTQLSPIQQAIEERVTGGVGYRNGEHLGSKRNGIEGSDRDIELHAHLGQLDLRTKRLSPIERIALSMNVEAFKMANFTITHPEIENLRKEEDYSERFGQIQVDTKYDEFLLTHSDISDIDNYKNLSNLIGKYPNNISDKDFASGCNKGLQNIPPKSNQNSILPTSIGITKPDKYE